MTKINIAPKSKETRWLAEEPWKLKGLFLKRPIIIIQRIYHKMVLWDSAGELFKDTLFCSRSLSTHLFVKVS